MKKIKESIRIKAIENKWNNSIESLLHGWHWKDNLMHKEIGKKLGIPRPTITRWFKQLEIPSQSCTRFTNNNLRHPPKKPKPPKKPHFRLPVNENFFKNWSPEMAYVLGFFAADGCMFINPGGSHYIEFESVDREIIEKVRKLLNSNHSIGIRKFDNPNWKTKHTLEIGSKEMFNDLLKLGLTPRKVHRVKLPSSIPSEYLSDLIRGYFDGDGCVGFGIYSRKSRKSKSRILYTRFISGNKKFLGNLLKTLKLHAGPRGGFIVSKNRGGFELCFSTNDSKKLYDFMYTNAPNSQFLERKYNKFQEAFKILRA